MLVHDRFVFLHVPKTGGRFVREAIARELPDCRSVPDQGSHGGWDRIPEEAAGRPVLAFVRNPWDWYVSWYCFVASRPASWWAEARLTNPLVSTLFLNDRKVANDVWSAIRTTEISSFSTTVRRACTGIVNGNDPAKLQRILRHVALAEPLLEGHDFYTARLMTSLGTGLDSDLLTLGRFESIVDDLESFVRTAGVDIPDDAWARIRAMEPVGVGQRGPYREYYDEDLRDLVGSSCKALIDKFDYSF